ncbi:molybdenum cofactor guanylyltransferase [Sphingomonas cavernae]|uniref:Molybdenum cofactor guanylyltransferase n=1 Tax=Sphingomonas cavernae TaxID=2320861 RepID=A0A418WKM7_9SPHN|nr:molybdenum cofactor guanylyltransferase [Sphingomonas cavernae]RJF90565.1 molybdenum cofactor guanylyltransferase [Sphingomonas cavernae]
MKVLGAIIAGGQSRRFGSDKALARIGGKTLLDHVAEALAAQTDALIICGREWPGLISIPDRPAPDQGPLGGLCAALRYAADNGFDAVLTAGCDTLPVPTDLLSLLNPSLPREGQGVGAGATAPAGKAIFCANEARSARHPHQPLPWKGGACVLEGQHIFGLWPASLADALDRHLASQPDRSMRGWFAVSGVRQVSCDIIFHNLNTPEDLALYLAQQGLAA